MLTDSACTEEEAAAAVAMMRSLTDVARLEHPPVVTVDGWCDPFGRPLISVAARCVLCGSISDDTVVPRPVLQEWFDSGDEDIQATMPELPAEGRVIVQYRFLGGYICAAC